MDKQETAKTEEELEKTLYSTLNVGSFLEIKKRASQTTKKEVVNELFSKKEEKIKAAAEKAEEKTVSSTKKAMESPMQEITPDIQIFSDVKEKKVEEKEVNSKLEKKEPIPTKEIIHLESKKKHPEKEELEKESEKVVTSSPSIPPLEDAVKEEKKETLKQPKKKKGLLIGVIICILLDLFAFTGLFLTYGPISYFRNMLVTSAMTTQSHHYLARIFYSDKTIQKVLAANTVGEIGENTNTEDINFANSKDTGEYESVYEEQILKRDEDQLYKVIDIEGSNYKGYLVAIYDASRVELVGATSYGYGGALPTEIAKKNNAQVLINASGFVNASNIGKGSVAVGTVIQDGKVIGNGGTTGYGGGLAGFNKDHVLVLTKDSPEKAIADGMIDAVEFGPFLIVNGKAAEIKGNGGWGIAPRTVLAQRKDGIVLFLVIDGRNAGHSLGVDMSELIKILTRYKAYNAVNLDGGGSSSLVVDGKLTNIPCGSTCGERYIPNAWIVK